MIDRERKSILSARSTSPWSWAFENYSKKPSLTVFVIDMFSVFVLHLWLVLLWAQSCPMIETLKPFQRLPGARRSQGFPLPLPIAPHGFILVFLSNSHVSGAVSTVCLQGPHWQNREPGHWPWKAFLVLKCWGSNNSYFIIFFLEGMTMIYRKTLKQCSVFQGF